MDTVRASKSAGANLEARIEPGRGVYNARRAGALAGVPLRTLSCWAEKGIYQPSISPGPRTRLWSWSDLLALRAIDWLRTNREPGAPPSVSIPKIRKLLRELEQQGLSRQDLHQLVLVSEGGDLFLRLGQESAIEARPGRQVAMASELDLVAPYLGRGPDLLEPRLRLRIIPGKLHGEPHLVDTRIASATIYALAQAGYTMDQIRAMYPEAESEALRQAIDLERSLHGAAA